jgi:hypothetical protein
MRCSFQTRKTSTHGRKCFQNTYLMKDSCLEYVDTVKQNKIHSSEDTGREMEGFLQRWCSTHMSTRHPWLVEDDGSHLEPLPEQTLSTNKDPSYCFLTCAAGP